jgi:hypothetical protein
MPIVVTAIATYRFEGLDIGGALIQTLSGWNMGDSYGAADLSSFNFSTLLSQRLLRIRSQTVRAISSNYAGKGIRPQAMFDS